MKLVIENRHRNQIKEKMFYVGILTIITIVLWIGLSIYLSFTKTSIDPKMTELTKPLNPVLDQQVLLKYESSRIPAPEQFQITAIIKNNDQNTSTTKTIDPFNSQRPISSTSATIDSL